MICDKCKGEIEIGMFPFCSGKPEDHAVVKRYGVIGDDIPGGQMIPHAICNPDGTPKRYDSKSEIKRALREKGFCHLGDTPKAKGDRWV